MSRTASAAEDSLAAPDETAPIVRFEGVGMRYGRAQEVLRDVSFELEPGSFHFLTGPSGSASQPAQGYLRRGPRAA